MAKKRHSYGCTLAHDTVGGSSPVTIGGVKNISGPGMDRTSTDVTDLSSANAAREFIPGLIDGGEVTFDLHADDSELNTIRTHWAAGTHRDFTLTWPALASETGSAPAIPFEGFFTGIGNEVPEDDAIMVPITIKVTKLPTFSVST